MKRKTNRAAYLFFLLCGCFLVQAAWCTPVRAAEEKPFLVVSAKSVNAFLEVGKQFAVMTGYRKEYNDMTKPIPLIPGLDRDKPIGIVVFPAEKAEDVKFCVFAPMSRVEGIMMLATNLGIAIEKKGDSYVLTEEMIENMGMPFLQELRLQQVGSWFFLGNMKTFPKGDPTTLLADIDGEKLFSIMLDFDRMPNELRDGLLGAVMMPLMMNPLIDQNALMNVAPKMQERLAEFSKASIEIDSDPSNKNILCDFSISAKPGSSMAKSLAAVRGTKTRFVAPPGESSATFYAYGSWIPVTDDMRTLGTPQLEETTKAIKAELAKQGLGSTDLKLAQDAVQAFNDAFASTLKQSHFDGFMRGHYGKDTNAYSFIFAAPDAKKVAAALAALGSGAETEDFVKINYAKEGVFSLSSITISEESVPQEVAVNVFESKEQDLKFILGVSDDTLCFAFGTVEKADSEIKEIIAYNSTAQTQTPEKIMFFDFRKWAIDAEIAEETHYESIKKNVERMIKESEGPGCANVSVHLITSTPDAIKCRVNLGSLVIGQLITAQIENSRKWADEDDAEDYFFE